MVPNTSSEWHATSTPASAGNARRGSQNARASSIARRKRRCNLVRGRCGFQHAGGRQRVSWSTDSNTNASNPERTGNTSAARRRTHRKRRVPVEQNVGIDEVPQWRRNMWSRALGVEHAVNSCRLRRLRRRRHPPSAQRRCHQVTHSLTQKKVRTAVEQKPPTCQPQIKANITPRRLPSPFVAVVVFFVCWRVFRCRGSVEGMNNSSVPYFNALVTLFHKGSGKLPNSASPRQSVHNTEVPQSAPINNVLHTTAANAKKSLVCFGTTTVREVRTRVRTRPCVVPHCLGCPTEAGPREPRDLLCLLGILVDKTARQFPKCHGHTTGSQNSVRLDAVEP